MFRYLFSRRFRFRDFNNLFVGAFLMLGLALLFIYTILTLEKKDFFADTYTLYANFDKGLGINKGTDVQVNGVAVGKIESVLLTKSGNVVAKLSIRTSDGVDYNHHISTTSEVYATRAKNLISDRIIYITHGGYEAIPLQNNDTLLTAESQDIETLLENVNELLSKIDRIAVAADSVIKMTINPNSTVGALLGSRDLYDNLEKQLNNLDVISKDAKTILATVNSIAPSILSSVDTITSNAVDISKKGKRAFTDFESVLSKADKILGQTETLVGRLHNLMMDSEDKLERVDDLVSSVNSWWIVRSSIPDKEVIELLQEGSW